MVATDGPYIVLKAFRKLNGEHPEGLEEQLKKLIPTKIWESPLGHPRKQRQRNTQEHEKGTKATTHRKKTTATKNSDQDSSSSDGTSSEEEQIVLKKNKAPRGRRQKNSTTAPKKKSRHNT
eukprot:GHVU01041097.1.p2 GENE.GHVU01041097.1~~GHVU01041097.1.p2  ORF type:complete len:121 (+),score=20.55 GHVU01041097.1:3-365(+)